MTPAMRDLPKTVFGESWDDDESFETRLGFTPYNGEIETDIREIAGIIVKAGEDGEFVYMTEIADRLGLPTKYVELIQTLLSCVMYPPRPGAAEYYADPFTYGTSPRGLFCVDLKTGKRFLSEFDEHLRRRESGRV
jgi:hypothetical protein